MSDNDDAIYVKSHVARDLLQNASLFKTDKLVVWEYISNGLQYIEPGTSPMVRVELDSKKRKMAVIDNGRGMDWQGLKNFFVMHGENIDRKEGHPGRGRFGTGKSAAFGIADVLRVTTVRKRIKCIVEIRRADIEKMSAEDPIPVRILEKKGVTSDLNGTIIEIEGIHLRALDQEGIIRYVERHLAKWPKKAMVFVNNHQCEVHAPPVAMERRIKAEGEFRRTLGGVVLVLKVSKVPLEEDLRGISIYSNGIWHETTLAGSENREMAQYLFGEVDVPLLDDDKSPISPFDLSRSMRLNPSSELVQKLYAFIGRNVEIVRRELVESEKIRKTSQDAKRLAEQASEIARIINEDFEAFRNRIIKAKARAGIGPDIGASAKPSGKSNEDLLFGSQISADMISATNPLGDPPDVPEVDRKKNRHDSPPQVIANPDADRKRGRSAGGDGSQRKTGGGFQVKYDNMGPDSHRAKYVSAERTIYMNLDHPQLVAAKGAGSVDDPLFRRLSYEVAFSEYAIALASELAQRDEYIDPSDPIFDIRETLNRVARMGALLYAREDTP